MATGRSLHGSFGGIPLVELIQQKKEHGKKTACIFSVLYNPLKALL